MRHYHWIFQCHVCRFIVSPEKKTFHSWRLTVTAVDLAVLAVDSAQTAVTANSLAGGGVCVPLAERAGAAAAPGVLPGHVGADVLLARVLLLAQPTGHLKLVISKFMATLRTWIDH